MPPTQPNRVLEIARRQGIIRARDLAPMGIPRTVLARLVKRGDLVREDRGIYRLADADVTEHHTLVEAAARIPDGVVNLISALAYHGLTSEAPVRVWLAVPDNAGRPSFTYPPLELTWTAPRFLVVGVTGHTIEGIDVRITDPARTVADSFKYRSRVGLDVALDALRDYLRQHRSGRDDLWEMAGFCRVRTVLRPYLEALS
jgi:predicted transcriptional regulator of viral defense system